MPLPLIDLFASADGIDLPWLGPTLRPGTWHMIMLSKDPLPSGGPPVLVGAPELPADASFAGTLGLIAAVAPYYLRRLKDIFSLIHVADVDFGTEDEGGTLVPPEPDGGGGMPAERVETRTPTVDSEVVETETLRHRPVNQQIEQVLHIRLGE